METQPTELPKAFSHLKDKHVTIVALGDSNTEQNHWTYGHCTWFGLLGMGLYSLFPKGRTLINSGRSGDTIKGGLERLERDVLRFEPDIVFIGYGINDCKVTSHEEFASDLKEAVRQIRERNRNCVIILRTPTPVINQMTGLELVNYESGEQTISCETRALFARTVCQVAEETKTLIVDHYTQWKKSMESSCHGDLCMLMGNPVHPNHLGHRRLYHEIAAAINAYPRLFHEWERILIDLQDTFQAEPKDNKEGLQIL